MDISDSVDHHEKTFGAVPSSSVKTAKQNQTKRGGRRGPPMSARQNKKQRKGRSNANNRERTVTTLTEDPNTPYLVPTSSEEPAGGHVSSHFAGNKVHNAPTALSAPFGGFAYPGGFGAASSNMQPQQAFYPSTQSQSLHAIQQQQDPPGQKDLALLQHIKKVIIENQHPFFRAVPQPAALAKLYKGPLPRSFQEQHSEQSGLGLPTDSDDGVTASPSASASAPSFTFSQLSGSQTNDIKSVPSPSVPNNQGNRYNISTGSNVTSTPSLSTPRAASGPQPTSPDLHSADFSPHSEPSSGRYERPSGSHAQIPDSGPTGNRTGGVKSEPLDDPMDGTHALHGVKDDLSRPESWAHKSTSVAVQRSRSDSDRSAASRGPSSHADNGSPGVATSPGDTYVRDADSRAWGWQERDRHRPQETKQQYPMRSASVQRSLDEPSSIRKGADVPGLLVEVKDALRPAIASDRLHVADAPPVDSKRPVNYSLHPDPRATLPPRPGGVETSNASAIRPTETRVPNASGLTPSEPPAQDRVQPPTRQSTGDTTVTSSDPGARSNSRFSPHQVQKKKFQKNQAGPHATNNGALHIGPAPEHLPPPPRSAFGRPPSPTSGPPPTSARSFRQRSPSVDERRGGQPSPGGSRYRPPPNRDLSRERASVYRPDYGPEGPVRYEEGRPYSRDYLPPPPASGERGSGAYIPAGAPPPRRDWNYGSYTPNWSPSGDEPPYLKSGWEGRPPPPAERDRYGYPRSAGWSERDYPGRDSYPSGPPTPADDRYADRGRPPAVYPPYNRVRPRSPSPVRRQAPDILDDRPPVKRSREEFPLVDYYPPPSAGGGRRGAPVGDYPPPRSGSPGPPGTGSSWPPPPSSTTSVGPPGAGPPDRDYRMGSYPPPASGGYDRSRSPGPPGRSYPRGGGGYARDGGRGYSRP